VLVLHNTSGDGELCGETCTSSLSLVECSSRKKGGIAIKLKRETRLMNFLVIHHHSTHHRSTNCRNPISRHFTDSLSAIHLLPIMLVVHQTFASFTALKQVVEEWAISENFSTRMPIKDSKRVDFRCHQYRETNCPFRVYATQQKNGVEIRILESLHTCNAKKRGNTVTSTVRSGYSARFRSLLL